VWFLQHLEFVFSWCFIFYGFDPMGWISPWISPTFRSLFPSILSKSKQFARTHLGGGLEYVLFSPLPGDMIQVDEYYWNGLKPPTRHGTPSQMGHLSSAFLRARTFHPRWRFVQKAIFELIACKIPPKRWHSLGKIIFLRFVQGVFFGLYQGKSA